MAKTYSNAQDVEDIARRRVIPAWHGNLSNLRIAYLFDEDGMTSKGKTVLAKVRKANPVESHLNDIDFIMFVNLPAWVTMPKDARIALVDHELCHIQFDAESGKYTLAHHDFEDFVAVVRRHGAWTADLQLLADSQPTLFDRMPPAEQAPDETVIDALPPPQAKLPAPGR